jgi:hypothetical protein
MLASDFDGERAVAAKKIAEMAREDKTTVAEFVSIILHPQMPPVRQAPSLRERLDSCYDKWGYSLFTQWEKKFSEDILNNWHRPITPKQEAVIERILRNYE